jgi:hypothetical protein
MSAFDCDVCGAPHERCGCAQDQTALRWERAEMLAARALAQHATPDHARWQSAPDRIRLHSFRQNRL